MSDTVELLTKFSQSHGTSGYEEDVRNLFVREVKKLVDEVTITPLGSVVAIKRATAAPRTRAAGQKNSTPRVLVEAHLDEIGLIVIGIEDGFIRFEEVGSFDARILPSQNVLVHGRRILPGVIGARPPHVLTAEERKKTIPLRELFIDVGMTDANVRQIVGIGDFVTLDRSVSRLQNEVYSGKAFDDRAGIVTLLEMLRRLQKTRHGWDVYAVANVNEEQSLLYLGAMTSTFQIHPQIAICLDVTHARQPGASGGELPQIALGPCIARGPNVHPFVFDRLRQTALRSSIPHQVTVYAGNTETNTWMMQVSGGGVPTGLIEFPIRYMHTPVETIAIEDMQQAAELTSAFIASLSADDSRFLQGESYVREAIKPNGAGRPVAQKRRARVSTKSAPKRRGAKKARLTRTKKSGSPSARVGSRRPARRATTRRNSTQARKLASARKPSPRTGRLKR